MGSTLQQWSRYEESQGKKLLLLPVGFHSQLASAFSPLPLPLPPPPSSTAAISLPDTGAQLLHIASAAMITRACATVAPPF